LKDLRQLFALLAGCLVLQGCVTAGGNPTRAVSDEEAAQANLNLGVAYLRQGRPDLALDRLERAVSQNPRLADAHSAIAIAYDQLGDNGLAEQHYRRAIQLEPNNPTSANSFGVFLCRNNRWSEAERHFRNAADNPRYATPAAALTNAGVCAHNAGQDTRAEQYFREALTRDPAFPDALIGMLELAFQQGNHLQARAFLQRYLDAAPVNPTVLWYCVHIERELGNTEGSNRCAAQLREQYPESADVVQLNQFNRDAGR
jgi:type IV pilus assembly protein PilF